jgi:glycosyltransferase involved in cell wall biosynthesis
MSFSLLEAGIAGAKIVASDIPANSIVCRDFARLTTVSSAEALAKAIAMEWNRQRSAEEVQRQIALCRSRYDWAAIARTMEPILAQMTNRAGRPIAGPQRTLLSG